MLNAIVPMAGGFGSNIPAQAPKKYAPHTMLPLVIAAEKLANEGRCMITPEQLALLTQEGIRVVLEKSAQRIFADDAYIQAAKAVRTECNLLVCEPGQWKEVGQPVVVLGVKDPRAGGCQFVPHANSVYVHFDHSYKGQEGASGRLRDFVNNAVLLDHEYFVDKCGKRTHAFGFSAGYATTAMALVAYLKVYEAMHASNNPGAVEGEQKLTEKKDLEARFKPSKAAFENLDAFVLDSFPKAPQGQCSDVDPLPTRTIKVLVLGGEMGRSAKGAIKCLEELNTGQFQKLGIKIEVSRWGREDTAKKQKKEGLDGLVDFDVILNCTGTEEKCSPFVTNITIDDCSKSNPLQIIGDVTCDPMDGQNRIRVDGYKNTDFDQPMFYVAGNTYAITVDHSPSLFPGQASLEVAEQFFPHLLQLMFDSSHENFLQKNLEDDLVPAERAWEKFLQATKALRVPSLPVDGNSTLA